ncbi:MAG: hypothetical protein HKN39_04525 [Flavobacteriales bacterium]|nr:hypothetical protein [Flavobacteriales bacterium]
MRKVLFLLIFPLISISCEKDEPPTSLEMLEGKWVIDSMEILAQVVPGDGSYLEFNACSSNCTGEDYRESDMSTGNFTYDLSADASTISIIDTLDAGGNYNATWDILELTEEDFRIVGNTILGSLKIEMSKTN